MSNATETPATEIRCERCHRVLRSAASIAAKIGPRCAAIEQATEGLNGTQRDKALELIADGGIIPTGHQGVYRVASSGGDTVYLAAVTGHCSCAWGVRRSSATAKTCYHVAAVKLTAKPRRSLAKAA